MQRGRRCPTWAAGGRRTPCSPGGGTSTPARLRDFTASSHPQMPPPSFRPSPHPPQLIRGRLCQARSQVGKGLLNRLAGLYSLATQFQTRFVESIPCSIAGLKWADTSNRVGAQVRRARNQFLGSFTKVHTFGLSKYQEFQLPSHYFINYSTYPTHKK